MKAIIVGHSGQDGSLLSASLEAQGHTVLGFSRSGCNRTDLLPSTALPSLADERSLRELVREFQPDQIYYLAAHHGTSEQTETSGLTDAWQQAHATHVTGLLYLLVAIRDLAPACRLFYAASSLVFSSAHAERQSETTPLMPQGFYGITKANGMWLCREFRETHGVFASAGILYNHESHLRPPGFLSQKVIRAALRIAQGSSETLVLGDLSAQVDWSYAPDFIDAFQRVLALDEPTDFVIASGELHSVREFAEIVFSSLGLDAERYVMEEGKILHRRQNRKLGDPSRLMAATGWRPSCAFDPMVRRLLADSQAFLGAGAIPPTGHG